MWHRGRRTGPAFLTSPVTGSPELATDPGSNHPQGIGTRRRDRSPTPAEIQPPDKAGEPKSPSNSDEKSVRRPLSLVDDSLGSWQCGTT